MNDDIFSWASRHGVDANAIIELLGIVDPSRHHAGQVVTGQHSEASVVAGLQVVASQYGGALWRNNAGVAVDQSGRHIRYGLGNTSKKLWDKWKSPDLIGITPVKSTQAGQVFGVFTAIDAKRGGWKGPRGDREIAQSRFMSTVHSMGGLAMFCNNVEDFREMFK